ncbi:MAG: hypothetical protein ACPLYX_10765 [Rectinema subterraneum]|uniref:hypothetical protein n=1 Tax=Rectinema subterraneum TaxID=2653714 RepID=UPI003C79AD8D
MSECAKVAALLAGDSELGGLLGPGPCILQGSLAAQPPYSPPLVLVSAQEGIPLLENEDGIVAERCRCTIGILAEHSLEELKARIRQLMETSGYRCEMVRRLPAERAEWHSCEMSFTGARLRI